MMNKYKIFYKADGEIIEREVTEEELQEFMNSLGQKQESTFKASRIRSKEERCQE